MEQFLFLTDPNTPNNIYINDCLRNFCKSQYKKKITKKSNLEQIELSKPQAIIFNEYFQPPSCTCTSLQPKDTQGS